MKRLLFLIALLVVNHLRAAYPLVTNVAASQRAGAKLIDIRYDVSDSNGDLLKVRIEISDNGGRTYAVPASTLTGDIGANIASGTNKLIVWNAAADWDGEYSPQMRVKVIASDGKGFPGMEWGSEVPPGGFLLGQDGGPEGAGPSRHVNIPWSYWLGKFEVTTTQYAEFLNMALVTGEVYRQNNTLYAREDAFAGVVGGELLFTLGTHIQWSVSKFVVTSAVTNLPVQVNWFGAMAFAQHYGYDLPTDAEWEKAARGFDFDSAGEHQTYPWGNSILSGHANFLWSTDPYDNNPSPVGYFNGNQTPPGPDMANQYGLYDMSGNVAEWTRTTGGSVESYPQTESLTNAIHSLVPAADRMMRGGSYLDLQNSNTLKCFARSNIGRYLVPGHGFRVIRRASYP